MQNKSKNDRKYKKKYIKKYKNVKEDASLYAMRYLFSLLFSHSHWAHFGISHNPSRPPSASGPFAKRRGRRPLHDHVPPAPDPVANVFLGEIFEIEGFWCFEVFFEIPRKSSEKERNGDHD